MSPDPEPPELPALTVDETVVIDQAAETAVAADGHHGPFHSHCENCGTPLSGPYCHRCGQHDFEFHRSFWHVFLELLETIFHFEGKFFRNIITLLFYPGKLSVDFNRGKRASQMPPFRLYIFVSFLFFILIFLGNRETVEFREPSGSSAGQTVNGKVVAPGEFWSAAWKEATAEMTPADWQNPDKVAQTIEQVAAAADPDPAEPGQIDGKERKGNRLVDELRAAAEKTRAEMTAAREKGGPDPTSKPSSAFTRMMQEKGARLMDPEFQHQLGEAFKHHLPHLLLLCLPLFALYTRALFRKSGQVYLQHLVVALHFHTFIYLWVLCRNGWAALVALPDWGFDGWVMVLCNGWLMVYPLLMLRRLFVNSWPKTIIKTALLAGTYAITLGVGFLVTLITLFLVL